MKRASFIIIAAAAILIVAWVSWYRWDSATNHGLTWGYWGQYNTVSNALSTIPGITILKSYHNADITLEEFGFDVAGSDGRKTRLAFDEKDPIRDLSGEQLKRALMERIRAQSSSHIAPDNRNLPR